MRGSETRRRSRGAWRRRLIGALSVVGLWCSPAAAQTPPELSRTAFEFSLPDRGAWFAAMEERGVGQAATTAYAALVSEAEYLRYARGERTRTDRIRYVSEGRWITGVMVSPRTPGPHPLLVYNHGGVMQWGRITLADVLEFNRLAERGYVVVASAYSGEGGSEGEPDMGGGDVADVLALMDAVAAFPEVDASRIGMWGFSRGGLVTYGVLARTSRLRAAAIVGGPTDLLQAPRRAEFDAFVYPHAIRDYGRDKDAVLAALSPILWPERLAASTPLLILHGGDDPRVEPSDSLRMASALQGLKRSYRLKLYEGGSHDLLAEALDVRDELDRWFDRYVRDGVSAPANGVTVPELDD